MTSDDRTAPPSGDGPDIAQLTYEQARDELVRVVQRLESGAGTLEESLALWERGELLAARCQEWLDGARRRLEAASGRPDGTTTDLSPTPVPAEHETIDQDHDGSESV
ncbi:MAG: exodeoxyribonuclease VII small subunit [Actinobacteria bacterium]|nr:exodeoxyribonuclease VII small subunit [Actinomycetota bacterium]MCG2801870.1 exodeoxyribonuclease VII small subunit [Cellulomonas sp.]